MKIYLARHGLTNYNDLNLCDADPSADVHLTPTGIAQAQTLADSLESISIDHIFVSELRRTHQTANIVNTSRDLPVETDPRLDDIRTGYEGKPYPEYEAALNAAPNRWTARFNDGESIEDTRQRVAAFLDDLRKKPHDAVLIITSAWIIRLITAHLQNLTNEQAWSLEDPAQGSYQALAISTT